MMPEIAIIFVSIIVMLIVIGVSVNALVRQMLNYKREKEGFGRNASSNARVAEIADRTDLIEDRLRVLERIATDRGQIVADEIEALRDEVKQGSAH